MISVVVLLFFFFFRLNQKIGIHIVQTLRITLKFKLFTIILLQFFFFFLFLIIRFEILDLSLFFLSFFLGKLSS